MASAAYGDHPELCVNDNFENATFNGQYTFPCGFLISVSCSGFIAVSHSDKAIILSFRGSDDYTQILEQAANPFLKFIAHAFAQDNEHKQSLWDNVDSSFLSGKVNTYFLSTFKKIWNAGMKNNFLSLQKAYSNYKILTTGHSLGGALASIAAGTIADNKYASPNNIMMITFGQPRVGDSKYAASMNKLVPYTFRVINGRDPVTLVPPTKYGYHHHGKEIWYDVAFNSSYKVYTANDGIENIDICYSCIGDHLSHFRLNNRFAVNGCPKNDLEYSKRRSKSIFSGDYCT